MIPPLLLADRSIIIFGIAAENGKDPKMNIKAASSCVRQNTGAMLFTAGPHNIKREPDVHLSIIIGFNKRSIFFPFSQDVDRWQKRAARVLSLGEYLFMDWRVIACLGLRWPASAVATGRKGNGEESGLHFLGHQKRKWSAFIFLSPTHHTHKKIVWHTKT